MPTVAEHHVADDQETPFVADHFEGEIDRAAGASGLVHGQCPARGENATKKPLAILHRLSQDATSCKLQAVWEAAMAKLIMWNLMTLDGFVEGPGRDISWHFDVWARNWRNCRSSNCSPPAA